MSTKNILVFGGYVLYDELLTRQVISRIFLMPTQVCGHSGYLYTFCSKKNKCISFSTAKEMNAGRIFTLDASDMSNESTYDSEKYLYIDKPSSDSSCWVNKPENDVLFEQISFVGNGFRMRLVRKEDTWRGSSIKGSIYATSHPNTG